MAETGREKVAPWVYVALGVLVCAELAFAGLALGGSARWILLGLFLGPAAAFLIVFRLSWSMRLGLAVFAPLAAIVAINFFSIRPSTLAVLVETPAKIDVKKYVLALALQPDDTLKAEQRLAGIATLDRHRLKPTDDVRSTIIERLRSQLGTRWTITDIDLDAGGEARPNRITAKFAARFEAAGIFTVPQSALVGRAWFELPREVASALRYGDLGAGAFNAEIETPSHALIHWDDDTLVDDLPPLQSGAKRYALNSRSDAQTIGFDFVRTGYRNAVTQFFLADTPLQIALYALAGLGSILLILLGIARDAITEERIKPIVVRFLRKLKILAPQPPPAAPA